MCGGGQGGRGGETEAGWQLTSCQQLKVICVCVGGGGWREREREKEREITRRGVERREKETDIQTEVERGRGGGGERERERTGGGGGGRGNNSKRNISQFSSASQILNWLKLCFAAQQRNDSSPTFLSFTVSVSFYTNNCKKKKNIYIYKN